MGNRVPKIRPKNFETFEKQRAPGPAPPTYRPADEGDNHYTTAPPSFCIYNKILVKTKQRLLTKTYS